MGALSEVEQEHRRRLAAHVEQLPSLADGVGQVPWSELGPRVASEHQFLVATLIPHMEKVEAAVHTELDRLLSCRLGMEPLEREHAEIKTLISRLGELSAQRSTGPEPGELIELHRILVKLYSILRVHLREESLYIPILEHNLTADQASAIAAAMDHAARVEL